MDRLEYHCPEHGRLHAADLYYRPDTARTPMCRGCDRPAVLRYKYSVPIPDTSRFARTGR